MVSLRELSKVLFRDFSPREKLKVPLRDMLLMPLRSELKGDEALDMARLSFLPLACISLGRQRAHATTNPSVHSVSVQSPINSALRETSASAMTGAILTVKTIRMADAIQALSTR
jgi:hypothetical protein